ncbi:Aldo/keto reductase [Gonapodya prolifera JEL478]|uniref:Aldo/keto reductase n=1 Tax=Gonapodya prolifera (strain JEL478) TaxID=1344416 RepID=A0A139AGZ3_GONPJ|nr:Aldo/keto reductase [Gonapodya prolifera JEL478]|eukprot:KXS15683.1 Aldo/keto reductase [Gonapodya prolifera JEL478]
MDKTPIEKTMEALVQLKNEGKIKYIGLSEISASTFRRASKIAHVDAIQVEYSPFAIETPQLNLLATAKEVGTAVVAYSPLGHGMLSGTIKPPSDFGPADLWKYLPRFSAENFPKNPEAQDESVIPIPGTTSVDRLKESFGASSVSLSDEESAAIRRAVEAAEIAGGRYLESLMADTYADT